WHTLLGGGPRRLHRLRYSPSCVLLLAGSRAAYPDRTHHEITFGTAWRETFAEVIDAGRPMSDPSFLVTPPPVTDPGLAPPARHPYYVLSPSPNLTGGQDWAARRDEYVEHMVATLEARGYPGFGAGIEVRDVTTPADWAARGLAAGTPFAAAHSF